MKNNYLLFIVASLIFSVFLNAQSYRGRGWEIQVAYPVTNHPSVRGLFDGFFAPDNWSANAQIRANVLKHVSRSFALDTDWYFGHMINKRIRYNAPGNHFYADDQASIIAAGIRYKLANGYILKEGAKFDPFIRLGGGYTKFQYRIENFTIGDPTRPIPVESNQFFNNGSSVDQEFLHLSLGTGFNWWIGERWGINYRLDYYHVPRTRSDYVDFFMQSLGIAFKVGGKKDRDKDGITDDEDECPDTPGLKEFNGCPDTDGDGIPDHKDDCPTEFGLPEYNGCPWVDTDGDGIQDKDDKCPTVPGIKELQGCPKPVDTDRDGDGIIDKEDKCPDEYCPRGAEGCTNDGCKLPVIEIPDILFDFDKATLRKDAQEAIKQIANFLKSNTDAYLIIGHTDSVGPDKYNYQLGLRRAQAVLNALKKEGIDTSKYEVVSKGETEPKCSNATAKGRQCNRRVEIKLKK